MGESVGDAIQKNSVSYVTHDEDLYPDRLKTSKNPPIVLFLKGNKDILAAAENDTYIGVVGTRKVTEYGRQITERMTADLVDAGCVIVSGLAMGVDAIAHQTTLDHKGWTIAVLGSGVDICTPLENESLYAAIIAQKGLIVSEYGLGVEPNKGSFPARNRIIAGLSHGIVVTEGAANSGALITARDAKALDRPVFAIPGPVTSSLSQGTYQLIKQGAIVVSSGKEIIDAMPGKTFIRSKRAKHRKKGDTTEEQLIIDLLLEEDLSFDELIKRTNIVSATLGSIVSLMEMKGILRRTDAGSFRLQD